MRFGRRVLIEPRSLEQLVEEKRHEEEEEEQEGQAAS